jgi:GTPase
MAESNFVDYVKIYCRSGKGGRGSMHLRHVKYNPNGGPDGGDGGHGGSIILRGNHNYWTLLHLKFQRHVFAEHGGNGGRDKCHGKDGKDVYIDVPCGTVVYNAETGKYVCDVTYDGQEVVLLKGGRGGLGNFQFRTATNQAPRYAQPGEPMEEMTIILELKLLADVGLVGLPNAGKSTLLSAVSSARPKIANYPFTTLEPSLGIVDYRDHKSFVMADIPGIIEGASEGKGLGLRFLRHIERNSLLLFMVPGDTDDIKREYELLKSELEKFNPEMLNKHRVLAVTKCDMLDEELIDMLRETLPDDLPVVFISSKALCAILPSVPRHPACMAQTARCSSSYNNIGMQSAVDTPTHTPSTLVITASTPSMSISLMFWGRVRYSLLMIRVSVPCTWWGTMMFGNTMPMVSESS